MICQVVLYLLCLPPIVVAQYTPSPRWAQAVSLLDSTLYVHGGLSDPYNSYSYTSAPEISDLLVLDLSTSFNASSPPWKLSSSNSSPALAWHTLSAFSPTELLLFGGQPGPNSLTTLTTLNDSAGLLSTNTSSPSFFVASKNWANEPIRRMRHSSSFAAGKVWVFGGEEADGSGNAFNTHYSFNPSGPQFVQLPFSSSAPPDIYGHASLVLLDGRLLVLGGYCASCSELVPMSTVWSLNTTQDSLVWEKLSVSNASLPLPRRDFAAVVLSNGHILIHGGGDAQLQTTYSDGWILDTSQNPMVWSNVESLVQLGKRKDHMAVQANGYVMFSFGYGSSSPASASLFIYNPETTSMVTSYTAPLPDSTPAITSLPPPTQTGSSSNSNGQTNGVSPAGSQGSPSATSDSSSSGTHNAAIALGTAFGVLGLVAGGLATMYYMKRTHNRRRGSGSRFFPLPDDTELTSEEGSVGGAAPEAAHLHDQTNNGTRRGRPGVVTDVLALLGVDKFDYGPPQPRRDMFVDEDTRSFGVPKQPSGGTSNWSIHSVSALARGTIGPEPSTSEADQGDLERQKLDHLREGAQEGLIRQRSLHSESSSHPTHRKEGSLWSYTDPFEDPLPDDEYDNLYSRPGLPEKDADYDHSVPINDETDDFEWTALGPQDSAWPFSVRSRRLTPLREVSHASLSDPSNSLPSLQGPSRGQTSPDHVDNAVHTPPASISVVSCSPTASHFSDLHLPTIRHSILSSPTLSRSQSLSRPDSWWSRLTKPVLLDRRSSITSSKPVDFRDPAPAPPLAILEEARKSPAISTHSEGASDDMPVRHGRTVSSAHSGRTANTDSAEHLGGCYDVVQRLASDGSSSRRAPSLGSTEITEQGMLTADNHAPPELLSSSSSFHADPPQSTLSLASSATAIDPEIPFEPVTVPKSVPTSPTRGLMVGSKVMEYERRMSQELESQQIFPPRNTRRREEVPSRSRPTIRYGVVPRASLFIANPDLGHVS